MTEVLQGSDYKYTDQLLNSSHQYLLPAVTRLLGECFKADSKDRRVFDLGCGNGSVAAALAARGYDMSGADPSEHGIAIGRSQYPNLNLFNRSGYQDLASEFGCFPVVVCLEVVEHLYYPRRLLKTAFDLVEPGGSLLPSTPFHGYMKNFPLLGGHRQVGAAFRCAGG